MSTPHNTAEKGAFAKTVLMPGDPLRAKFIAETYFDDCTLVNNARGIQGYTGTYKGKRVSVMASGMGMPSLGIYTHELFNFYDVDTIIRVGSAGMISRKLKIRSVVAAMSAYTNSNYGDQFGFRGTLGPCCSYDLLEKAVTTARQMNIDIFPGPVFSSDIFYSATDYNPLLRDLGVLAVEMETYALYLNAAKAGKKALSLLTISDDVFTGEGLPDEDRRLTFKQMIEIALQIAE